MDSNAVLLLATAAWVVFLFVFEAWAIRHGKPTISSRVRALGRGATIVIVISMFVLGYLAAHFWDNFVSACY